MGTQYEAIRHAAIGLRVGENISITCPFCLGGVNKDRNTCSIGRPSAGTIVFICHRVKCPKKTGRIAYGNSILGGSEQLAVRRNEFIPRVYSGVIEELPDDIQTYLADKYGIEPETSRECVRWDPDDQRTVWQITSPAGAIRGYELRAIRDQDWAKTLSYRHSPDPWIGYFRRPDFGAGSSGAPEGGEAVRSRALIIVEDVVSALKVSKFVDAASLMGTSFTLEKALDIAKVSQNVILALDRDATVKAGGMIKQFALYLPGLKLLPLQKDMKYWTFKEIEEFVYISTNLKQLS